MATKITGKEYYGLDGQLNEIKRQLRQSCGYPYNPTALKRHLQAAIDGKFPSKKEPPSYTVTINYNLSIEALIRLGGYDCRSDSVTSANFPMVLCLGRMEIEIFLINFDREISTEDAFAEINKQGFRPAEIPELLAFGAAFPNLQREFPIAALGSVWRNRYGTRFAPYLCRLGLNRCVLMHCLGLGWNETCRFAAVRK